MCRILTEQGSDTRRPPGRNHFGTAFWNTPLNMQCSRVTSHVDDMGSPKRRGVVPCRRHSRRGLPRCHDCGLNQHLLLLGQIAVSNRPVSQEIQTPSCFLFP